MQSMSRCCALELMPRRSHEVQVTCMTFLDNHSGDVVTACGTLNVFDIRVISSNAEIILAAFLFSSV